MGQLYSRPAPHRCTSPEMRLTLGWIGLGWREGGWVEEGSGREGKGVGNGAGTFVRGCWESTRRRVWHCVRYRICGGYLHTLVRL